MYNIDGQEGGGSVLRVAVPLALAQGKSIRIFNIRSNRRKPGLRTQHLLGLKLLEKVSGSTLTGGYVGSTEITFTETGDSIENEILLEIGTAASVSLILQIAINYSIAAKKDVHFKFNGGGTFTEWSPTIDYCKYVLCPIFRLVGLSIDINIEQHGFYPKGGAKGSIDINFKENSEFNLLKGDNPQIYIYSTASSELQNASVAERQSKGFNKLVTPKSSEISYYNTPSVGSSILACMKFSNGLVKGLSVNGKRGIKAEKVGEILSKKILTELNHKSSVDEFMADQLLVTLALSPKGSRYTIEKITDHVKINLAIIKQIIGDRIDIVDINGIIELRRK